MSTKEPQEEPQQEPQPQAKTKAQKRRERGREKARRDAEEREKSKPPGAAPVNVSQSPKPGTKGLPTTPVSQSKGESSRSPKQAAASNVSAKGIVETGESSSSSTYPQANLERISSNNSKEALTNSKTPWSPITLLPATASINVPEPIVGQQNESTHESNAGKPATPRALHFGDAETQAGETRSKALNQRDQKSKTPSQSLASIDVPLVQSEKSSMRVFQNGLETNHFSINIDEAPILYRYDCSEEIKRIETANSSGNASTGSKPQEKKMSGRVRRRVFVLLLENLRERGFEVATDYATHLVSAFKLSDHRDEWTEHVLYFDEDKYKSDPNLTTFVITIKPAVEINLQKAVNYLTRGKSAHAAGYADGSDAETELARATDALNLVFSHIPNQDTVRHAYNRQDGKATFGREPGVANIGADKYYSYAFTRRALPLSKSPKYLHLQPSTQGDALWSLDRDVEPKGLLALLGFFRSVRAPVGPGFLLNINAVTGCFYQWINLHDLIMAWWGNNAGSETAFRDLEGFISGLRVRTTHMTKYDAWIKLAQSQKRVPRERIFTISGFPGTANLANDRDYPWVWKNDVLEEPTGGKVEFKPKNDQGEELAITTVKNWWEKSKSACVRINSSNIQQEATSSNSTNTSSVSETKNHCTIPPVFWRSYLAKRTNVPYRWSGRPAVFPTQTSITSPNKP